MVLYHEECGHPNEWNLRLVNNGRTYTYCLGCVVEKLGLNNLEEYNNPFVKSLSTNDVEDGEVKKLYADGKTPTTDLLEEAKKRDSLKKKPKTDN